MSHHKSRTKTSTELCIGRLFPSPALISAGPGPLAALQLLPRAPSHCSQEKLYSLMKMAKRLSREGFTEGLSTTCSV